VDGISNTVHPPSPRSASRAQRGASAGADHAIQGAATATEPQPPRGHNILLVRSQSRSRRRPAR